MERSNRDHVDLLLCCISWLIVPDSLGADCDADWLIYVIVLTLSIDFYGGSYLDPPIGDTRISAAAATGPGRG